MKADPDLKARLLYKIEELRAVVLACKRLGICSVDENYLISSAWERLQEAENRIDPENERKFDWSELDAVPMDMQNKFLESMYGDPPLGGTLQQLKAGTGDLSIHDSRHQEPYTNLTFRTGASMKVALSGTLTSEVQGLGSARENDSLHATLNLDGSSFRLNSSNAVTALSVNGASDVQGSMSQPEKSDHWKSYKAPGS